jgi:hypothetical protein
MKNVGLEQALPDKEERKMPQRPATKNVCKTRGCNYGF